MTEQKESFPIPIRLIVLDAIGTLLFGLGAAQYFAGFDLISGQAVWEDYGIAFMLIGALLFLPMLLYIVRRAKEASRAD